MGRPRPDAHPDQMTRLALVTITPAWTSSSRGTARGCAGWWSYGSTRGCAGASMRRMLTLALGVLMRRRKRAA